RGQLTPLPAAHRVASSSASVSRVTVYEPREYRQGLSLTGVATLGVGSSSRNGKSFFVAYFESK
ncbi:MAG TPA: hypothetical protein VJS64_09850, partial [Pyrinomonadaceae bacterium]|nr:hypothetical protein [Pyrinomonadaceae bacterium]